MDKTESIDGVWYCANFLGDSFQLTTKQDGALQLQMVRKRFRARGKPILLESRGKGLWEAEDKVRLCFTNNTLLLQCHRSDHWGSETQAFRTPFAATEKYFKSMLRQGSPKTGKHLTVSRLSSSLFKFEPFSADSAFETKVEALDLSLVREIDDVEDASDCKICMEFQADVVLIPCGHGGCCELCLKKMSLSQKSVTCPFCRKVVEKVAKIDAVTSKAIAEVKPISTLAGTPKVAWA